MLSLTLKQEFKLLVHLIISIKSNFMAKLSYQSGKNKEFRFRLKATMARQILSSEGYTSKASCLTGSIQ
jgi:uncharacterized protein YegP (UPF0339 family)